MSDRPPLRGVRSYVMRGGRTTEAQQRALDSLWPRYGLPFEPRRLELGNVFGREAPRTLEIGFGNGDNLIALAAAHPERDYLGVEVHRPGVGRLLLGLEARGLINVRVIAHDAVEVVQHQLPASSLDEILILFPDPWPKKRHHKRRLLQPAFVEMLSAGLRSAGVIHFATDWEPYAQHALEVLRANFRLRNLAAEGGFAPRPAERSPTRFEKRGERLGLQVWDLTFVRD